MARDKDILSLLERYNKAYPNRRLNEQELADITEEWLKVLGGYNAELLNEALTEYIASDTSVYARLPKAGELRQICDNILEERERQQSLEGEHKCFLCYGKGQALLNAAALSPDYAEVPAWPEDLFYSHYGSLGVACPCRWPEELKKLRQGQQVRRFRKKKLPNGQKIVAAYLEMWLARGRLYGRIREVAPSSPAAIMPQPEVRQQSINSTFDDLPF